jgi:hypothetical protein
VRPGEDDPARRSHHEIVSDSVEDTWASRDLPVLQEIVSPFNDPERHQLRIRELIGLCGPPERKVQTAPARPLRRPASLVEYPRRRKS